MTAQGVDAIRADGGPVHIRAVRRCDRDLLHALNERSSDRSLYLRFFSVSRHVADDYLDRLLRPPDDSHSALVAIVNDEVIGVAALERIDATRAEIALLVSDLHQHLGIGTLLLEHLAELARPQGVQVFIADVLAENSAIIQVLHDLAFDRTVRIDGTTERIEFSLEPTAAVAEARAERQRRAELKQGPNG